MATGVKPREDLEFSQRDVEMLGDALKDKNFRKLLSEYCEEMQDPAKQALYQKEMTQLEKERGVDITFINPSPGYVIKTSVAGEKKAFINICSNDKVGKPTYAIKVIDGRQGLDWKLPYSLIPPREDLDKKRVRCVVYDVVFHPNTLELAHKYKRFREMVNTTACEALKDAYNIVLDQKNFRFPKMAYKGVKSAAVIRKPDPDFKPVEHDAESLTPDILDKVYPQKIYSPEESNIEGNRGQTDRKSEPDPYKLVNMKEDPKSSYTTPKYTIKQQRDVDFEEFTFDRNAKQYTATPNNLIIHINLPLISSTSDCTLDVQGKSLKLVCEKPARYKLNVSLPYMVDDELGNAKFDKSKHLLIVTLPVVKKINLDTRDQNKTDSGVESETNSPCPSDDDSPKNKLVTVLNSKIDAVPPSDNSAPINENVKCNDVGKKNFFLDPNLSYTLPAYTHNIMDNIIAFTLHVKNTDQSSLVIEKINSHSVQMKFMSVGSSFVPLHYSVFIKFADETIFESVSGEAWDNNVILQIETNGKIPELFSIGYSENNLRTEVLDLPINSLILTESINQEESNIQVSIVPPVVEVCNVGFGETNITVTSNDSGSDSSEENKPTKNKNIGKKKEIVWAETGSSTGSTKGILRNSWQITRSLSESSFDGRDIASSMDYVSSDSIPEESRSKKTVRFSDVIAKKVFRLNSSILGQKKKNQRKKDKKKNQERRKSESEADEDQELKIISKPNKKSDSNKKNGASEKFRRDSGVADTSDTDGDNNKSQNRTEPCDTPHTNPHSPKHKTGLYDPQKLNQGQYLEVSFKNDLIFDLDL